MLQERLENVSLDLLLIPNSEKYDSNIELENLISSAPAKAGASLQGSESHILFFCLYWAS